MTIGAAGGVTNKRSYHNMTERINPAAIAEILTEGLSRGLIVISTDYRILLWNRWMEKHSGIKESEMLGQNIFEKFPEIQERNKESYLKQCIENKRNFILSPLIHHYLIPLDIVKNDETMQMSQYVKIYPFPTSGETAGAVIIIRDLTEQILYEREIARLTRLLRGIRNVNQLITRVESEDRLMNGVCEIMVRDMGYRFSWIGRIETAGFHVIPAAWSGFENEIFFDAGTIEVRWDDSEYGQGLIGRAVRSGKTQFSNQIQTDPAFKPWRDFIHRTDLRSSCALPLNVDGQIIGTLNLCSTEKNVFHAEELDLLEEVASDISFAVKMIRDRNIHLQAEEQLRHSQKMEAVGLLAGGIAHDFNNILAIIIGYTEIMKMFDISPDNPIYGKLEAILGASYRAKELVEQILTFCHKTKTQKEPLQLAIVVKETLKFLRASLPATVEITQHLEKNVGTVLADPGQMHQVMMNLCTNAAHAMKEKGGILHVELRETKIDAQTARQIQLPKSGSYVNLAVKDTGCGMDEKTQKQIFDPYFTTKEAGEGTGLGLSVVHGIVSDCKGTITVKSEPGKGSIFEVFLPANEKKTEESQSEDSEPIPRGNECILFVDDEEGILTFGQTVLSFLGYEIVVTMNSMEALEIFRKEPNRFDLVITDQTMPKMTGDELSRELMRIRHDIPIILCTGFAEKMTAAMAESIGIRAYVIKPLNTRKIARIIREVLDGENR
jgi:signal transduction histidine kinase/CheY-like chemotaxis protein